MIRFFKAVHQHPKSVVYQMFDVSQRCEEYKDDILDPDYCSQYYGYLYPYKMVGAVVIHKYGRIEYLLMNDVSYSKEILETIVARATYLSKKAKSFDN